MSDPVSAEHFRRAQERFPGGVNSPVRAFRAVGGTPVFVDRAEGAYLWGADGKKYVDYVGSWGPMIVGHAHPDVVSAVQHAMTRGASYGAPTAQETDLADLIAKMVPSISMMRFTSSGTEAVMGALRVARGFTGRDLVVKFEGCYHGGADYLLVKAGSGLATFGVPTSAGVPAAIASTCTVLPYNDVTALHELFAARGSEIAAVILEPVVGNMGTVPPDRAFLDALRALTTKHGALLVFDEVMTGFRLAKGGAQERFGITPDLTTLGKIVGGGLPVGVYGGRREIMEKVSPIGPVYQAGTLSGNPLAVAAGLATLRILDGDAGFYDRLEAASAELEAVLVEASKASKVPVRVQRTGSMITPFFCEGEVRSWEDAARCDTAAFGRWHHAMLDAGVMWPPAQYEAGFVSSAHDQATLRHTAAAARAAFAAV
ncbi:glutamate-1-semialdehyde 2,1-aminomutase [Sandaracinus amylolyticus]|uniref:Glutamate-1-semialdehyde 2,1-aminomutase n=1 Tax=Sandaracinus amylolyticus TaxID=927083 RepID=A0A0F6W4V1_9BACT|nr:glutamate-1-semialdehyde 2,1-aminomutase [Sandaracinus amylolyticus]AKF07321.1 Glutamate-1-semialdehyde aminotransferase [Sandaracinus amylolyticus]